MPADTNHSTVVAQNSAPRPKPCTKSVADQFISQYYTVLSDYPRYMHRFYRSASSLLINETRGDGSQEVVTASSEKEIQSKVLVFYMEARVRLEAVCLQTSMGEGIMLLVTGELTRKGKPDCLFAQSFFLAQHGRKLFVLNDIMRIWPCNRCRKCVSAETQTKAEVAATGSSIAEKPSPSDADLQSPPKTPARQPPPALSSPSISHANVSSKREQDADTQSATPSTSSGKQEQAAPPVGRATSRHQPHSGAPVRQGRHLQRSPVPGPEGSSVPAGPSALGAQRASSIFVRAVPESVDGEALVEAFKQYGQVREGGVTIKQGRRDRFAFVEFASVEDMDSVLKGMGGKALINGQMVTVEEKRPMVIRGPGKGRRNLNGHTPHSREPKVPVSVPGVYSAGLGSQRTYHHH